MTEAIAYPVAADFPASSAEAWRGLVDGVLKGAAFDRLVGRSADGLAIQPLYAPAGPATARALRRLPGAWAVSQRVDHPDAATANSLALADLEGGADALNLVFAGARTAHGFGVEAANIEALDDTLSGVELDFIHLRLDSPGSGVEQARLLKALVEKQRLVASTLKLDFGCDPIGAALAAGSLGAATETFGTDAALLALELREKQFGGAVLMADGRPVHAAGGTEAQELAHLVSSGLFYLRLLERHGFSPDQARHCLSFTLTADADQYLSIAKFRALRLLWARVEEACGLAPSPIRLHAETAWRMLTRRDPYVNVLRTSMAVFAAGIGGADSVTALPLSLALGLPDAFARRIARNSQLVLLEEAHLAAVADPAAGAGGFEALTQGLCAEAWGMFQATEKAGGIVAALIAGGPQQAIATSGAARRRAVASRKIPLTGTSEFPDLHEIAVPVLAPALQPPVPLAGDFPALVPARDAEPFEALRDSADRFARRAGAAPKVFLALAGNALAARTAFAANAFAVGGIEAVTGAVPAQADGASAVAEIANAAMDSGAQMVCLCGTDADYAAHASAAVALLSSHFSAVFIAGKPLDPSPPGVHYIHAGGDLVAALQAAHASLQAAHASLQAAHASLKE